MWPNFFFWSSTGALEAAILSPHASIACVELLYAAGFDINDPQEYVNECGNYEQVMQMILEDHYGLQPLSFLCRRRIRKHLLDGTGHKHKNLFLTIPKLPLPTSINKFLLHYVEL